MINHKTSSTLAPLSFFSHFHTKLVSVLDFQFHTFSVSHKACASTFFSFSPPLLFSLCASNLFFYLLFLVLLAIKSSDLASSFSSYMLHISHSTALLSHFSVSYHPQAIQSRSRHLLTHLRGAQPQIFNYGEGKLYLFHPSLKSLNVFSFWIDFSIL